MKTYLITGAATGFGQAIALALAKSGERVIAGVETLSEVSLLLQLAKEEKIELQVEKLDITDPADRERAGAWPVDVLLNNAGISLGGSLVDIPEAMLRQQFEINVFGTILLTQQVARQMIRRQSGKIVFVTSVHGVVADPLSGPYCGSKFALEAFAESLAGELREFHVQVATIEPGPYLTGFNDREYDSIGHWRDDPSQRVFNYAGMSFPYEQIQSIDGVVKETIAVLTGNSSQYRTVVPKVLALYAKKRQKELWDKKSDADLGQRHPLISKAADMDPATTVTEGITDRIKEILPGVSKK